MANNKKIEDRRLKYIAKTAQISYYPAAFEKGEGAILYDANGTRYIDFLSSASSANLGHGNTYIADAVYKQMCDLSQYTFAYFNQSPAIEAAEKLTSLIDYGREMQVLFSTTGSEAIDSAIKLARAYTGRSKIISMYESYHGSTYGAISLSALSLNMRRKIGPLLPEIYHFHYPNKSKNYQSCLDEIHYAFEKYLPPEEVAAIFIEPMAGDMGLVVPPKEWVQGLREICDEHGILLVSDEIQLALGRTGKYFAIEHFDVQPDLYVLGKSLGGGLPVGAVIGTKDIMQSLDAPAHLFTLSGSNASMAATLANLELLETLDANKMSTEKGEYLRQKLETLRQKYDFIGDIRGYGLSIGADIIDPATGDKDPTATAKICYTCIHNGLILIFLNQATLRIQPPLVITYEELDEAIAIIDNAMQAYQNGELSDEILEEIQGW